MVQKLFLMLALLVLLPLHGFSQAAFNYNTTVYLPSKQEVVFNASLQSEPNGPVYVNDAFVNKIHMALTDIQAWSQPRTTLYVIPSDTPIEDSIVVGQTEHFRFKGQVKNSKFYLQHYIVFNKGLTFDYVEIGQTVQEVFKRLKLESTQGLDNAIIVLRNNVGDRQLFFRFSAGKLVEMGW